MSLRLRLSWYFCGRVGEILFSEVEVFLFSWVFGLGEVGFI